MTAVTTHGNAVRGHDDDRLRVLIDQLARQGASERDIVAEVRAATGQGRTSLVALAGGLLARLTRRTPSDDGARVLPFRTRHAADEETCRAA